MERINDLWIAGYLGKTGDHRPRQELHHRPAQVRSLTPKLRAPECVHCVKRTVGVWLGAGEQLRPKLRHRPEGSFHRSRRLAGKQVD
jgi:hypothetical protein